MNGCGSSWFVGPFPHIPSRLPAGYFGDPASIAPNFEAMEPAERKAAVNLMLEAGEGLEDIAKALAMDVGSIEAIRDMRCRPIAPRGEPDETKRKPGSDLLRRPVPKMAVERALDEALLAVDALRAKAGSGREHPFDMTFDVLCQACGFGLETARRRFRELESRKWVRRKLRPGLPPQVTITLAGRCRLDALVEDVLVAAGRRGKP
ncbi:MAG: hypothetical protein H6887_00775 [Hoeflea sp.]|nr:hypothetical protein [Hoeflea sp.]